MTEQNPESDPIALARARLDAIKADIKLQEKDLNKAELAKKQADAPTDLGIDARYEKEITALLGRKPGIVPFINFNPSLNIVSEEEKQTEIEFSSQGISAERHLSADRARQNVRYEKKFGTMEQEVEALGENASDVAKAVYRMKKKLTKEHGRIDEEMGIAVNRKILFRITNIALAIIALAIVYFLATSPTFNVAFNTFIHNQLEVGLVAGLLAFYGYLYFRYRSKGT